MYRRCAALRRAALPPPGPARCISRHSGGAFRKRFAAGGDLEWRQAEGACKNCRPMLSHQQHAPVSFSRARRTSQKLGGHRSASVLSLSATRRCSGGLTLAFSSVSMQHQRTPQIWAKSRNIFEKKLGGGETSSEKTPGARESLKTSAGPLSLFYLEAVAATWHEQEVSYSPEPPATLRQRSGVRSSKGSGRRPLRSLMNGNVRWPRLLEDQVQVAQINGESNTAQGCQSTHAITTAPEKLTFRK